MNAGKYFASSKIEDKKILINFAKTLSKLGFEIIYYPK